MEYGIDVFDGLGLSKAFCPTGDGGGIDNSCSPNRGGRPVMEVGVTSARPGKAEEQVLAEMVDLQNELQKTPARNVRVTPGRGGWEGGHETTFATSYDGNGETRKAIIRFAKKHDQDAVLFMQSASKDDPGALPRSFATFSRPLSGAEVDIIEAMAADSGFGGWTWTEPGRTIMFATVPQYGGTAEGHQEEFGAFQQLSRHFSASNRTDWVIPDLVKRDNYDQELSK